jgi:hypothetical protein
METCWEIFYDVHVAPSMIMIGNLAYYGGVKKRPKMGCFLRVFRKVVFKRSSLNRKNPPNYTVLNGAFWPFSYPPLSGGVTAVATPPPGDPRDVVTPVRSTAKTLKNVLSSSGTSMTHHRIPAPRVATQRRPLCLSLYA